MHGLKLTEPQAIQAPFFHVQRMGVCSRVHRMYRYAKTHEWTKSAEKFILNWNLLSSFDPFFICVAGFECLPTFA